MKFLPKVSIVVPVYNAEDTIKNCIDSILSLNYPTDKLEFIFVNNSSKDSTETLLEAYDGQIKIVYERKSGPAAARNTGILNSSGDVIAFTDADCIADGNWVKNIVCALQDLNIGIVGGRILSKRPCNKIEKFGEQIHDHYKAINEFKPPYVITMNWASRRSVLMEAGLFDETYIRCEDVDLSHRINEAGYELNYEPEAIIYHNNENTLRGLFKEGYLHGFWAVKVLKEWKELTGEYGHRRFNLRAYKRIFMSLIQFIRGGNRNDSICFFVFNSGKKIGKLFGSISFLYLDL